MFNEESREESLRIRFTADEKENLVAKCKLIGVPPSIKLRELAINFAHAPNHKRHRTRREGHYKAPPRPIVFPSRSCRINQ